MPAKLIAGALCAALSLPAMAQSVAVVAGRAHVAVHDLATGAERARFAAPGGSTDIPMTPAGVAILNHTAGNQLILIDAASAREIGRMPSSSMGGTRPVHAYLTPMLDGRQFFVALNDGVAANTRPGQRPADSTMLLVSIVPGSPGYLQAAGEVRLGIGHHKAGFSIRRPRVAVSNISDCDEVITVYDFTNPCEIVAVKTFSAADFGLDGQGFMRTCDPAGRQGIALSPHGTGTSADGKPLSVQPGTIAPPGGQTAESTMTALFDIADPRRPVQLTSIAVGRGSGAGENALSGDGRLLLTPDTLDSTVSVIGVAERRVVARFASVDGASRVATFGPEGPSKPVGPATKEAK